MNHFLIGHTSQILVDDTYTLGEEQAKEGSLASDYLLDAWSILTRLTIKICYCDN